VFDTGPLLCAAFLPDGPDLLEQFCGETPATMILDVQTEMRRLAAKSHGDLKRAAARGPGAFPWMNKQEIGDSDMLDDIELMRERIDTFRTPPKGTDRHEKEDWVDAASIVWARKLENAVLVMHDGPATAAARGQGLVVITFVDILRHHCRPERSVRRRPKADTTVLLGRESILERTFDATHS
jgi:hypothetical protein